DKVSASGDALAGRHHFQTGPVGGVHDVLLVAIVPVARRLKDQTLPVGRPISFGVLASLGELVEVGKMLRGTQNRQQEQEFHRKDYCKPQFGWWLTGRH